MLGYSFIERMQAARHSTLDMCVALSQNPMQSARVLPPPPGALGAASLGLLEADDVPGDRASELDPLAPGATLLVDVSACRGSGKGATAGTWGAGSGKVEEGPVEGVGRVGCGGEPPDTAAAALDANDDEDDVDVEPGGGEDVPVPRLVPIVGWGMVPIEPPCMKECAARESLGIDDTERAADRIPMACDMPPPLPPDIPPDPCAAAAVNIKVDITAAVTVVEPALASLSMGHLPSSRYAPTGKRGCSSNQAITCSGGMRPNRPSVPPTICLHSVRHLWYARTHICSAQGHRR